MDSLMSLEDMKKIMLLHVSQLDPAEEADPKRHPLEDGPKNEKKGNQTGGPFSEENFSKFVLRKKGYIIKDKQMIEQEQDQWRPYAFEDLKKIMLLRADQLDQQEEEEADPKRHPYSENQKKESKGNETLVPNGRMFGGPFSEENFSKFVLRKNGYIIEAKQVTPPNPLPERFEFSEETMSRMVLRRLGYTFTDEIVD